MFFITLFIFEKKQTVKCNNGRIRYDMQCCYQDQTFQDQDHQKVQDQDHSFQDQDRKVQDQDQDLASSNKVNATTER